MTTSDVDGNTRVFSFSGTSVARLFFTCALLLSQVGYAQLADSPRGMAMSGVRGDPVGSSAIIYNPAGMSRAYQYAAEAFYVRAAPGDANAVGLNVVDSKTQPQLAVGLSYGFQFTDEGADVSQTGHDARLAFAHPAIVKKLNLGVSLRYLQIEREASGVETTNLEGFTIDAGLLLSASNNFHIGLVGHNLVDLNDPAVPRRAGGGVAYVGEGISLDFDVLVDWQSHEDGAKPVFAVGLEAFLSGSVPLRAGYTHDMALETQWVSGGLGFMTGRNNKGGQLSISYRHNIVESAQYGFGLGLTIFL